MTRFVKTQEDGFVNVDFIKRIEEPQERCDIDNSIDPWWVVTVHYDKFCENLNEEEKVKFEDFIFDTEKQAADFVSMVISR